MFKQVSRIDDEGFFIEPVIIKEEVPISPDLIEIPVPEGLYKPKGFITQQEADQILATPQEMK